MNMGGSAFRLRRRAKKWKQVYLCRRRTVSCVSVTDRSAAGEHTKLATSFRTRDSRVESVRQK